MASGADLPEPALTGVIGMTAPWEGSIGHSRPQGVVTKGTVTNPFVRHTRAGTLIRSRLPGSIHHRG